MCFGSLNVKKIINHLHNIIDLSIRKGVIYILCRNVTVIILINKNRTFILLKYLKLIIADTQDEIKISY